MESSAGRRCPSQERVECGCGRHTRGRGRPQTSRAVRTRKENGSVVDDAHPRCFHQLSERQQTLVLP
eukprot:6179574-Pleurochrysis_carterae.AAC.1